MTQGHATGKVPNVQRSAIFQAYNAAKPLVRAGQIDGKRLNRALGVAQANPATSHLARYRSSLLDCRCPDHRPRGVTCKGQLAVMLLEASR